MSSSWAAVSAEVLSKLKSAGSKAVLLTGPASSPALGAAFMEAEALKNRHDWKTGRREEILKRTPVP